VSYCSGSVQPRAAHDGNTYLPIRLGSARSATGASTRSSAARTPCDSTPLS
jgi:hypothetical protein